MRAEVEKQIKLSDEIPLTKEVELIYSRKSALNNRLCGQERPTRYDYLFKKWLSLATENKRQIMFLSL